MRFPDVKLSKSERKTARSLWDQIGTDLETTGFAHEAMTQRLGDCPARVQQAIMRAAMLRVLDFNDKRAKNPFK